LKRLGNKVKSIGEKEKRVEAHNSKKPVASQNGEGDNQKCLELELNRVEKKTD